MEFGSKSRTNKKYPTIGLPNKVIYDNNPKSSVLKTNNQDLSKVQYTSNDINEIYKNFIKFSKNDNIVLVIKKPEHIRKTLPNGAIIEDIWIDKTLIVKNIIQSDEKYFPQNINKNLIDPPPLYLTVDYYDNIDSLTSIANGETVEPSTTILPYRINMNTNETDKPQKYDEKIPYPNEGTEYQNGIFINNYISKQESVLKSQNEIKKIKEYRNSPLRLRKPEPPTSSNLIKQYGSAAAAFVAILVAMYYMFNQKGGGPEDSNPQSELLDLSKEYLETLLKEIEPEVNKNDLEAVISNLPITEQKAVTEEASKYFPGFTFDEQNQTVFGNLFGDEGKKEGGKRKRTNKKRKTNKRRNNKKKSNRR